MNKKVFFNEIKSSLFKNKFSAKQVEGLDYLLDIWFKEYSSYPIEWLAYCLATAYHETAHTMQPIREYRAKPGTAARKNQDRYWNPYHGRGYVQLTWDYNYKKASQVLRQDFINNPDLVMNPEYAARILYQGMIQGWFTTKSLGKYITLNKTDFKNARRIVNGMDKASLIAGYAEAFLEALKASKSSSETVLEETYTEPLVTGKKLSESTTVISAGMAATAGVSTLIDSSIYVDILLAFMIIGLSVYIISERIKKSKEDGV